MQNDLFDRSFKAAAAKYKRMHGLEQQQTEAEDSQALEGWAAEAQQAQERNTTPTPHIASMADIPKQRVIYSKDDLTDIAEKSSQEPVESTSEPISHVEHQIPEDQQYSEADWAAYWQYYGYTAPPPPGPPLCPTHLKLLQQMLSATAEQPESAPVIDQQVSPPKSQSPRDALQSRAQCIQDGSLTDLLMAWFDAGYQMGKHEAQTHNR
ncbi:hypothetical protein WJX79_010025 [Trebouxia sp. C0005]